MQIQGKRALVTGGTKGIGAAVARDLAARGARVAVAARQDDRAVRDLVDSASDLEGEIRFFQADVGDPAAATALVERVAGEFGGLDILVHSAGGPAGGTTEGVSPEAWHAAFDVHVHAAFHLVRAAAPRLREPGEAAVVLVSSVAGIRGVPGILAYGTVKGAVAQMTRNMALDLADDNVRVNCVAPGIIRTRFHDAMSEEQKKHNLAVRIPLHREGTPDDVAEVVRLLVTNDFMTGEMVVVDGGMTMQISR
ncbi:SDR family NAD(P)-dependent oxidoreductase [Botrimarina sp.]|uniref:SDR family NAD(P)-dependent oxidoreductase n=1 Tax=Botrimarina sp. TaxID=2795802 RepID=UPI0032EC33F4